MSRSIGRKPPIRLVVDNPGVQLRLLPDEAVERALPLARQLRLMADLVGPASRELADELVEILEGPGRPRRVA